MPDGSLGPEPSRDPGSASTGPTPSGGEVTAIASPWRLMAATFLENKLAVVGLALIVLAVLFSFVGPLIYHTNQVTTNIGIANQAPSAHHLLGTDETGYDQLGRLMVGGQSSLEIGVAAGILATVVGVVWGAIAGFIGGWVDAVMMRVVDSLLAIPTLFLLLFIATIITPSINVLILVIAFVAWLVPARLVRGEALSLRTRDYVLAVRGMGGGPWRIVLRHIVPNTIGTIVVNATFQVADAILFLAALSYLGLGIPPPATNWGGMLSSGINYTYVNYWWLIFPPGLMIILVVVAFNLVGDAARDAFEVRLQRR
ncbi:MAG: ABC transporter permease [Actinomycetes bacterium]